MTDLIYLLNNLVDLKGNILIPGINDKVLPLTDDERATYTDIDFDKVSTNVSSPARSYDARSYTAQSIRERYFVPRGTNTPIRSPYFPNVLYKALWGLIVAYDVTIRRSQSQVKANERNWSRCGKAE